MDAAGSVPLQLMLQGFWSSANPLLLALRIAEATAIAVTGCGIFFTIVWVARRRRIRTPIDRLAPHPKVDASVSSFRYVADAMPQIVWTASADGALDYCNARWYEYTGMTSAQSLGWGWGPVLHPDDLANCVQVWQHAVEIGTPYDIEYRLKRAGDGAYRWHLGRALPFRDESGSIVRWFGTCTDIDDQKRTSEAAGRLTEQLRLNATLEADLTARKRAEAALQASEQRFRQIEEFTPIGLALVALDGSFLRVNPALCALIGYTCAELVSMTFLLLTHADDLAANLAFMQRTLAGEIANYDMEKRYLHKNGDIVWVRLSACLVRDDAGAPSYFIAQIQDIRARKAVENELRCAQAFTLAAMDAKSRFLATMSHEIRTPMNGIIGMAELLSESSLGVEQRRYVEIVRDSGRSLLRVLNDILDYSKIEAGKFELESVGFSVANQLESVISLLKPQFDANGVRLSTQVDVELPPILEGDPTRLRQIIVNLVGNALKFTPAGGSVRVVVATLPAAVAATQIMVRFAVVDTGVGVAPEVRDRLFRPFSQVDTSTTRK
jgi:two-component system sensor histidine kinase/response regulator